MARMRRQPQGAVLIDWTNPITNGLAFAYVSAESCAVGYSNTGDVTRPYNNSAPATTGQFLPTPVGLGVKAVLSNYYAYSTTTQPKLQTTSYSLFAVATANSTSNVQSAIDDDDSASNRKFQFRIQSGAVNLVAFNTSASGTSITTSPALSLAELNKGFTMGATVSPSKITAFHNKLKVTSAMSSLATTTGSYFVGNKKNSSTQLWNTGGISLAVAWSRTLSDDEMLSLAENPWQIFLNPEDEYTDVDYYVAPSGPTIVSAAGSSTGSASLSAVSQAIFNAFGSSSGTSTVSSSTVSLFYSNGSSVGSSSDTANGVSVYLTSGSSTNTATVSGNAYSIWSVQAATTGASTGSGSGVALVPVSGGTSGTSSVSGTGSALTPASGSANGTSVGTSTTSATAIAFYNAIANAVGSASVTGSGASTASTSANASGTALASGSGVSMLAASGTSSGAATAAGSGVILACASGAATGLATVNGLSVAIYGANGISVSAAQVQAIAASVASAIGSSDGRSTVSGVTEGGLHYTASGDKFSITLILSPYKLTKNDVPFKLKLN